MTLSDNRPESSFQKARAYAKQIQMPKKISELKTIDPDKAFEGDLFDLQKQCERVAELLNVRKTPQELNLIASYLSSDPYIGDILDSSNATKGKLYELREQLNLDTIE